MAVKIGNKALTSTVTTKEDLKANSFDYILTYQTISHWHHDNHELSL
jgi:hypothetical protein